MNVSRLCAAVLLSMACSVDPIAAQRGASPPPQGTAGTAVNADASLADFKARVQAYVEVKKQAQKDVPKLKETEDPAQITATQEALAARVRALRADAKPGDIITPQIGATFRRLLAPELKGEDGRDAKAVLKEDAPAPGAVPLKINAKYTEGQPLASTPATMLRNLPILPEGLEYRFIGKTLVLLDVDANIIVDYFRNAIR